MHEEDCLVAKGQPGQKCKYVAIFEDFDIKNCKECVTKRTTGQVIIRPKVGDRRHYGM
jgi:hypothetical protein